MISVLYVDDQKELLDIGRIFLDRTGDFRTDVCDSPLKVIQLMNENPYDVIISDYEMPGMDGLTLLKEIRRQGNPIPFIIFTGKSREEVVIDALNSGADFYLQKGGDPKAQFTELIHKIRLAILQREAQQKIAKHIHLVKRIAEISTRMMTIPSDLLDTGIQEALEEIGRLCRSDRCYLIQWDDLARQYVSITHEWCGEGISEGWQGFQHMGINDFLWYHDQLNQNRCIHIASLSDLAESDSWAREMMEETDLKSFLLVPILVGDSLAGVFGLDAVHQESSWTEEQMDVLKIFGQAILNAVVRKSYLKELTESEARYRSVVEVQTEFICRYRPDGVHLFVNEAYCRHFGLPHEEIIGKKFNPTIPEEDISRLRHYFASFTPDHPDGFIEHRVILQDGRVRWHQWADHAIFDDTGVCIEFQSVGRDITDRKMVEINLAESEELYRTVFESTGTAMMILDDDKTILSANRGMERLSGYSREYLEKRLSWTTFVVPEDIDRMARYHEARRNGAGEIPTQYEFTFITRDRRRIDSFITVGMIPGTKRSIVSIIDISKLNRAESALLESEEKFRKLAESLSLGVYMIQDERFLYVNPYISSLFGYSDEEIYSRPVFSFFQDIDRPVIQKRMNERVCGDVSSVHYQVNIQAKDGGSIMVEIQGSMTYYQGKPAFIGVLKKFGGSYDTGW